VIASEMELRSPHEHEGYLGQTLVRRDHSVIQSWAEQRQARSPAGLNHPGVSGDSGC